MTPADKQPEQQQGAAAAPADLQRAGSKRDVPEAVEGAEVQGREQALRRDKPPSFKVMGRMVLAMKRFSSSLNPTYTYGKRPSSSTGSGSRRVTAQEGGQQAVSSRPTSPEEKAFPDHGHRFDYLLRPLPPTEDEEA